MTYEQAVTLSYVRRALAKDAAFEQLLRDWLRDKAARKGAK